MALCKTHACPWLYTVSLCIAIHKSRDIHGHAGQIRITLFVKVDADAADHDHVYDDGDADVDDVGPVNSHIRFLHKRSKTIFQVHSGGIHR